MGKTDNSNNLLQSVANLAATSKRLTNEQLKAEGMPVEKRQ